MKAERKSNLFINTLIVLIAWCCTACNGTQTGKQESGAAHQKDSLATVKADTLIPTAEMKAGKAVYEQYCMTCHQANGKGVSGLNPPLIGTDYVTGDKHRLIDIILQGSNVGLEVNGMVYSNAMPAHSFLSDQAIADVLSYIRNSFGNQADTITVAEVNNARASLN